MPNPPGGMVCALASPGGQGAQGAQGGKRLPGSHTRSPGGIIIFADGYCQFSRTTNLCTVVSNKSVRFLGYRNAPR